MDNNEKRKSSKIVKNAGILVMIFALIYPLYVAYNELTGWRWSYGVDTEVNMFIVLVGFTLLVVGDYLSKKVNEFWNKLFQKSS